MAATATDLLEETGKAILEAVSERGGDASALEVIDAVSVNRSPAVVREAYWLLISENRLRRSANGRLSLQQTGLQDAQLSGRA